MGSKREDMRVDCGYPCILSHEGINYLALLENLSLSGALVKVANKQVDGLLNIGATIDLMLCSNPDVCPTKYSCKVIRLDSSGIGVKLSKFK